MSKREAKAALKLLTKAALGSICITPRLTRRIEAALGPDHPWVKEVKAEAPKLLQQLELRKVKGVTAHE